MAFEGVVELYADKMYINTETGEGIAKALKKIEPLLCKMAKRAYIPGLSFEDKKQEFTILALEGFKNYRPDRGTKLSSFIHRHMYFKVISEITCANKKSKNANFLRTENKETKMKSINQEILFSELSIGQTVQDSSRADLVHNFVSSMSENGLNILGFDAFEDYEAKEVSSDKTNCLKRLSDRMGNPYSEIITKIFFEKRSVQDVSGELNIPKYKLISMIKKLDREPEIKEYRRQHNAE